jgi:hypothetical protein
MGRLKYVIAIILLIASNLFAIGADTVIAKKRTILKEVGNTSSKCDSFMVLRKDTVKSQTAAQVRLNISAVGTTLAGYGLTAIRSNDTVVYSLYAAPSIVITNNHLLNYAGQSIATDSVSWTLSGSTIKYQALTDAGALSIADRYHNFTGPWTTDKYWTLTVTDSTAPITNISATTYMYFQIQKYMDTCGSAAPSAVQIRARASTWTYDYAAYRVLVSTPIVGGGKYIYYAFPASFGTAYIYANGFLETWNLTTVSITNSYGDTRDYYVYTSPFPIVGSINLEARTN